MGYPTWMPLVVFLVDDVLLVEAAFLKNVADVVDHVIETADEDVHIGSLADGLIERRLNTSHPAGPAWFGAGDGGPETEVGMLLRQRLELFPVHKLRLVTHAKHKRVFMI